MNNGIAHANLAKSYLDTDPVKEFLERPPDRAVVHPAEYVVGDFWDGLPRQFPAGLVKVYESNDGLLLFRRKSSE